MRFLHTADWQIGMKARSAGPAAGVVRQERIAAARRVVQAAIDHRAQFIAVAGDTFEDNGVDRVLVQTVADVLGSFRGPVYVIPGNHDPLIPGSVWDHPAWAAWPTIRVLRQPAPVPLDEGVLYPCPARGRHSGSDPTAWIQPDPGAGIRIGLAHGTVAGVRQDEPEYPIRRDAARATGLDYLALGHWHSVATYPEEDGSLRTAYAGTHEPTRHGERDSGSVLVVEIRGPGAPPAVTPVRTGRLTWTVLERPVRESGDLARVREEVEALPEPGATLLDLRVAGLLPAAEQPELARLEELLGARFLLGRLERSGLRPSPADESWLSGLPAGIVRQTAERLRSLAGSGDPQAESAGRALMELYAIAAEVAR